MVLPKVKLDDKPYQKIVQEAIARIPAYTQEWTNFNASDPGITLIELFSWLTESQLYRLNKITDSSKRKFLKLLGREMLPQKPKPATVELEIKSKDSITIPKNTRVEAADPVSGESIIFEITEECIGTGLVIVEALQKETSRKFECFSNGLPSFTIDLPQPPSSKLFADAEVSVKSWLDKNKNTEITLCVPDFDTSKPDDSHFTFDWTKGHIVFGDGFHGRIPEKGSSIVVTYTLTMGLRGNVTAGLVTRFRDKELNKIYEVKNKKSAYGGKNGETLDNAILRAQRDLRTPTRAVTTEDYEYLIRQIPEINITRLKVLPGYHPAMKQRMHGVVTIVLYPHQGKDVLRKIYNALDQKHRLLTTELFLTWAKVVKVKIQAKVGILPTYKQDAVTERVEKRLKEFLHPVTGGMDSRGWLFGRPVYIGELYEIIDNVEGVDFVEIQDITDAENTSKVKDLIIPGHALVECGELDIQPWEK